MGIVSEIQIKIIVNSEQLESIHTYLYFQQKSLNNFIEQIRK